MRMKIVTPAEALADFLARIKAWREESPPDQGCKLPPKGWYCSRTPGHDGPCAAMTPMSDSPIESTKELHESKERKPEMTSTKEVDELSSALDDLNKATNRVCKWRYELVEVISLGQLQDEKRAARARVVEIFDGLKRDAENWRFYQAHRPNRTRRSEY